MSEERITDAVERIERALARIEMQAGVASENRAAAARHAALKERVAGSLSQLDFLIEELEK